MQTFRHSGFGLLSAFGFRPSDFSVVAAGLLAVTTSWAQSDYATPYAFTNIVGSYGNQGFADGTNGAAEFYWPEGMAVDTNDNVYVVDGFYGTVRLLTPVGTNWVVSTIAGNPNASGSSTDGTNQNASFNEPNAIAPDGAGNLYVADTGNSTLRKLTPAGTNWVVTTIAGMALTTGTNDGSNQVARFNNPYGLAVDQAGKLYVSDTYNHTIRLVVPMGTNWVVSTIAGMAGNASSNDGTGTNALFNYPAGIAVDQGGNVYVADSENFTIRRITPVGTNWVVSTIAGTAGIGGYADGTNGDAAFNSPFLGGGWVPMGLAVDAQTNLYVADGGNLVIRKVSPVGTNWVTTTLAGQPDALTGPTNGIGPNAVFGSATGIAVDISGNVFMSDPGDNLVWEGSLAAVTTPPITNSIVSLSISLTGANLNSVLISWPVAGGSNLQTNADLTTTNWGAYGGTVSNANGTNSVTVSAGWPTLYFRLSN